MAKTVTAGATRRAVASVTSVPDAAVAIMALLNSRAHAIHQDALDVPETATAVLAGFGAGAEPLTSERVALVRALRADLMAALSAADDTEAAEAWKAVTARISGITFRHDFSAQGMAGLVQVSGDPVIGRITLGIAELMAAGVWTRIRVCANSGCRSVFYDATRSRTQRWHSYEICGNRSNVAAHRARVAVSGSPS